MVQAALGTAPDITHWRSTTSVTLLPDQLYKLWLLCDTWIALDSSQADILPAEQNHPRGLQCHPFSAVSVSSN